MNNTIHTSQDKPTYAVKCDDCRKDILLTHSLQESAQGGVCDDCAAQLAAILEQEVGRVERDKEVQA